MPPSPQTLSFTNLAAFILLIIINTLSNVPSSSSPSKNVLGTSPIGTVSDAYPTPVTPAGYTFSIWGLIYVCLGVYVVAQCVYPEWLALAPGTTLGTTSGRSGSTTMYQAVLPYLFAASCVLNVVWVLVFTQLPVSSTSSSSSRSASVPLAVLSAVVLLALAGCIYGWMVGLAPVVARGSNGSTTRETGESAMMRVVGGVVLLGAVVYCAWVTIACVLNLWTCASSAQSNRAEFATSNRTGATLTLVFLALLFCGLLCWAYEHSFPPRASWARLAFAAVFVWAVIGVMQNIRNTKGDRELLWVGGIGAAVVAGIGLVTGLSGVAGS